MCGIAGLSLQNTTPDRDILEKMGRCLGHRGPDDSGSYIKDTTGLAHTRLSIIDLAGGHQPLFAHDDSLVLVANGEIYNYIELRARLEVQGHHFKTHSDCEVILHAYAESGLDFLENIYGMFAFALYDCKEKRLILARDRLGIKPLFLAHHADGIAFGSEIKALLPSFANTPEINPAGLIQYLQNQFCSGRNTILKDVERILPGEAVCIESGRVTRRWQYWTALDVSPREVELGQALDEFEELVETVMRQHMRSDVPFGLFLSGGVDSSIVLALLSRYKSEPVRTFSVGFPDTDAGSELPVAQMLANHFGSRHTFYTPDRDTMFSRLPLSIWAADDLMRDNANLPTLMLAQEASPELKVIFSGEGGDEAFAGYGRYRMPGIERWANNLLSPGSGGFRPRGTFRSRWPQRIFGDALLSSLDTAREPFIHAWQQTPRSWSDLQRMQYTDIVTALPDNLLVKADRMLMTWGIEGRVPFVDHRIVEFGLALPNRLKIKGSLGKLFLRQWAERHLPPEHLWTRKKGFIVPVAEWLQGDILARLNTTLADNPVIKNWFKPAGIRKLIQQQDKSGNVSRPLWAIAQFAIWHRIVIENRGERPSHNQDPLELLI